MDTEIKSLWQKLFQKLSTMKSDGKILNVAGEEINPATTENIETLTQEVTTQGDNIVQEVNAQGEAIIAAVQNSGGSQQATFISKLTRVGTSDLYAASDVIGDVSGALKPFLNSLGSSDVTKANGTGFKVLEVNVRTTDANVTGKKIRVHFYKDSVAVIADNQPFVFNNADITKRKKYIDLVFGTGSSSKIAINDWNNFVINPIERKIYPIIEFLDGGTLDASSNWYIEISGELSNN